jgi:hypothetical protein
MKSKYLQLKKRETAYHAACDKAEEKYLAEVFNWVKDECDRWGLEFFAGNGGYVFTLPFANNHLMKAVNGMPKQLNQPWCDLIELICPELPKILDSALYSNPRCCIGCQVSNYIGDLSQGDLVCIQSNELEIDYQAIPDGSIVSLEDAKELSYGPMNRNLAEAILAAENAHNYWLLFDEFQTDFQKSKQ